LQQKQLTEADNLSMSDIAIRVENLSKQYRITEPTEGRAETSP